MLSHEREKFLRFAQSVGIDAQIIESLQKHLPDKESLKPKYTYHIQSPTYVVQVNTEDLYGLDKKPIELGYLEIGSCPNGDPVVVELSGPELPVFYVNHDDMHRNPFKNVLIRVADSISEFKIEIDKEDFPKDYDDAKEYFNP